MTEREWLTSADIRGLLQHVKESPGFRKLWLFNVVCCRRVWDWLPNSRARLLVVKTEQHANGELTTEEWKRLYRKVMDSFLTDLCEDGAGGCTFEAIENLAFFDHIASMQIADAVCDAHWFNATRSKGIGDESLVVKHAEEGVLCHLLREIVGNPFRPVAFDPAWRTSDVVALTRGIYDDRAFDRMPILADALQDAGCTNDDILNHCRDTNTPHARGCWVVDLVLGK